VPVPVQAIPGYPPNGVAGPSNYLYPTYYPYPIPSFNGKSYNPNVPYLSYSRNT
jgi:hypothetical protein